MNEEVDEELRRGLLPPDDDHGDTPKRLTQRRRGNENSSLDAVDRLVLSPWEKWTTHGRFPFKLVLHVALLLLTFTQMQLFDAQNAAYMRASYLNWCI